MYVIIELIYGYFTSFLGFFFVIFWMNSLTAENKNEIAKNYIDIDKVM